MWESTITTPRSRTKITAGWGTLFPTRSTPSSSFSMKVLGTPTACVTWLMRVVLSRYLCLLRASPPYRLLASLPGAGIPALPPVRSHGDRLSERCPSEGPEHRNEERRHDEEPHHHRQPQLPTWMATRLMPE